ncbi:MAG: MopE-related protein [Myxococcota bacterium]
MKIHHSMLTSPVVHASREITKRPLWHSLWVTRGLSIGRLMASQLLVLSSMSILSACSINLELPDDVTIPSETQADVTGTPQPIDSTSRIDIFFETQVLDFGDVRVNETRSATAYLRQSNPDDYPLGVTLVLEDGVSVFSFEDGEDAIALTLPPDVDVPLTLRFKAPVEGVYEGLVSVLLLGSSAEPVTLPLVAVATFADQDQDGFTEEQECDDLNPLIFPGQAELCNGIDDDCDGEIDEGVMLLSYLDRDSDGFGVEESSTLSCELPTGYVLVSGDCNDRKKDVNPNAAEVCNGVDDDCDGQEDEGVTTTYYVDEDRDGFGDQNHPVEGCVPGLNATVAGDCNDQNVYAYPGAKEQCFGEDLNCDGVLPTCFSCESILRTGLSEGSGLYTVDPDGPWGEQASLTLVCDMEHSGGGWSLVFVKNSSHVGDYGAFGVGRVSSQELVKSPEEASMTVAPVAGWLDMNSFPFEALRVAAYSTGEQTYSSLEIPRSALRVKFGEPGYLLYGEVNGYYWCAGDRGYTDEGEGQVNRPGGAPAGCKGHDELGSGWDFSTSQAANQGLTLSGSEAETPFMHRSFAGATVNYPIAGAAYALWVR